MWFPTLFILGLVFSAIGIKVPVNDNNQDNHEDDSEPTNDNIDRSEATKDTNVYYVNDDESNVDSYLIPPSPHKLEPVLPEIIVTPATYLLPPTPGQQPHYYYDSADQSEQSDWYPIAQAPVVQATQHDQIPIYLNLNKSDTYPIVQKLRKAKSHSRDRNAVPVPSTELEPPLIDAPNDYYQPIQEQIDIPTDDNRRPVKYSHENKNYDRPNLKKEKKSHRIKVQPTLAVHLLPPEAELSNTKIPTKLYPKKYGGEFKPVPIPIAQYTDESAQEIPRARPMKLFKPLPSTETDYLTPSDEKINYFYQKAEHKRKLKGEEIRPETPSVVLAEINYQPTLPEQDTSETHNALRNPNRNAYPAPLRQAAPTPQQDVSSAPAPDERTEFRMHGMKGPHSYQFGFDTGKGKNRQFRYEERDNDGIVKGHYGYMDKHGKLRVVNYSADPKTGFQAEAPVEKNE